MQAFCHAQRKPLYFENTGSTSSSKIGHDVGVCCSRDTLWLGSRGNNCYTLPAEMFGGTEFWLYTVIIIKIGSHPF